jgi:hypothetical protein
MHAILLAPQAGDGIRVVRLVRIRLPEFYDDDKFFLIDFRLRNNPY